MLQHSRGPADQVLRLAELPLHDVLEQIGGSGDVIPQLQSIQQRNLQ
jgi:hypothetical protein